jgi:hypothetical protein
MVNHCYSLYLSWKFCFLYLPVSSSPLPDQTFSKLSRIYTYVKKILKFLHFYWNSNYVITFSLHNVEKLFAYDNTLENTFIQKWKLKS